MIGCRRGAKNTLVKNYLYLAENLGVAVEPMRTVTRMGVVPGTGGEWAVPRAARRTGPAGGRDRPVVTTRHVVLAAGTWGTQTLLHEMKGGEVLPKLSDRLGHRTRTNSEAVLGATARTCPPATWTSPRAWPSPRRSTPTSTPTSRTADTARAATRSGCSRRCGGRRPGRPRWVELLRVIARDPMAFVRSMSMPAAWSERTVIALVMQSRDNS